MEVFFFTVDIWLKIVVEVSIKLWHNLRGCGAEENIVA